MNQHAPSMIEQLDELAAQVKRVREAAGRAGKTRTAVRAERQLEQIGDLRRKIIVSVSKHNALAAMRGNARGNS